MTLRDGEFARCGEDAGRGAPGQPRDLAGSAQSWMDRNAGTGTSVDASGDANFVSFETMAQGGDSGAPLFYDQGNGTLKLVGIAWYITGGTPPATGFSAVGDHASNIQSFIATNGQPFQPLAPSAFSGSRITPTRIDLTWQDNSDV